MFLGQWFGETNNGVNKGVLLLNIDYFVKEQGYWAGRLFYTDTNPELRSFFAAVQIRKEGDVYKGRAYDVFVFISRENVYLSYTNWQNSPDSQNIVMPKEIGFTGKITDEAFIGSWDTNIGTEGKFTCFKTNLDRQLPADYRFLVWADFKNWMSEQEIKNCVFRGQKTPAKLRTSFHRAKRNDLVRYFNEDLTQLQRYINAISDYKYNLNERDDNLALQSVGQHHGFPTPLLDWTESPYIAAYFAYYSLEKGISENKEVRIFMFDIEKWKSPKNPYKRIHNFFSTLPALVFDNLPVINNERAIPQQSLFSFTNMDDIEEYVQSVERTMGERCLFRIDLPYAQRDVVMRDLQSMGITHASLFPGKDGICKALKERLF